MGVFRWLLATTVALVAVIVYRPPPYHFAPSIYLEDPVFAPVPAEEDHPMLPVAFGSIPPHLLGGVFLRNGPNPVVTNHLPYHWFDGDGMLYAVNFLSNSSIALRNRWIQTGLFLQRNRTRSMYSFLAEIQYPLRAVRAMAKLAWNSFITKSALQASTANTALLWYKNRLYALMEAALPAQVDPKTLATHPTLSSFGGILKGSMTAHPKYDAEADELIFFGYIPPGSALQYYVMREGKLAFHSRIEFAQDAASKMSSRMPHDFACTKHWTVYFDTPAIRMHPAVLFGLPVPPDPVPPRLVWHRRHSNQTFSAPVEPGSVFHYANAWEEKDGEELVVVGCRSNQTSFYLELKGFTPYLHQWRINLQSGMITEEPLLHKGERVPFEFPVVRPSLQMKQVRYIYGVAFEGSDINGISKYDLETRVLVTHSFGAGRYSQEAAFIPDELSSAEDAGSLVTFVFEKSSGTSSLHIIDARTMAQQAVIPLNTRVPMGFHTLFLTRQELLQAVNEI